MTDYEFKKIDIPGGPSSPFVYISVAGVDADGLAVGNFGDTDGDWHGFTAAPNGPFNQFDPPSSSNQTSVAGITPSGEMFGSYTDWSNVGHGFVAEDGIVTTVDDPVGTGTSIVGINAAGVIFGNFTTTDTFGFPQLDGFIDNNGSFTTIVDPSGSGTGVAGVNASGEIVGTYTAVVGQNYINYGYTDINGSFTTLAVPGAYSTWVTGVTASGEVAGNYQDYSNNNHGYVYDNGTYTEIDPPGAVQTYVNFVSDGGIIVGDYLDSTNALHGFIDQNGTVTTVDVPGATLTDITGINAAGDIYGDYNDSMGVQHGFVGLTGGPVVTATDVSATTHGESFAAGSLFSASDPAGHPITEYALWDSGSGGAEVLVNGVAQASKQNIDLTPAQLAQTTYQSGVGPDVVWVQAYDGTLWSSWVSFTVTGPAEQPPVISATGVSATKGETFAAGSLFNVTDPQGNPITQYVLWDSGSGGAQVLVNGVAQASKQNIDLTPAQLAQTTYQSGVGADVVWVQAYDGTLWSNWTSFTVTGPIDTPPVVTATNVTASHGEVFPASTLFGANDPDGDPITQYVLWDSGSGGAQVLVNGVVQTSKQNIDLTPAQLAQTTYQSGAGPDVVWVQAFDGTLWSSWTSFTVTGPVDTGPVVTPTHASTVSVQGQMFPGASLFTYSDPFNMPATEYNFWNSGGGGGQYLLNGTPLPTKQNDTVTAAQLSQLTYEVGSGTDTLWIQAYDGTAWGGWTSFTISDPPTVPAGGTLELPSAYQGDMGFAGATGTLQLDQSSSFAGTISGLGGEDRLDLADIAFGRDTTVAYQADGGAGGTLNVGDGFHAANLSLLGQYAAASFSLASDGHGGTLVSAAETQPQSFDLHARG